MRTLSRRARVARTTAEATVARSLSEPATRRIDAEQSQGMLAAMRRLVQAGHVLRLDVQDERPRQPLRGLEPMAAELRELLGDVEATLRPGPDDSDVSAARAQPDVRARYLAFARAAPTEVEQEGLLAELDEIVDAANGLAALAGLEGAGSDGEARNEMVDAARASP
jgi:hypothetical protein